MFVMQTLGVYGRRGNPCDAMRCGSRKQPWNERESGQSHSWVGYYEVMMVFAFDWQGSFGIFISRPMGGCQQYLGSQLSPIQAAGYIVRGSSLIARRMQGNPERPGEGIPATTHCARDDDRVGILVRSSSRSC